MSGKSARSVRNFSLELWQDLVLPNVGQVDFHDFLKYWNFNVLEMALKTFRFVQGLPIAPLFFFDNSKPDFANLFFENRKSGNMEISKIWKIRAPKNNRDLSSQKCFKFRGVFVDW